MNQNQQQQQRQCCPPVQAGNQYSMRTQDYLTPWYGPTQPCDDEGCDPTSPDEWNDAQLYYDEHKEEDPVYQNIKYGGLSCAYSWNSDINLRQYAYVFQDDWYGVPTPIHRVFPNPPRTNYLFDK